MKFSNRTHHKMKPKLLHLLLSLILTISMTLPMFTAQTLEVHADPTDTTGQDSSMDNTGGSIVCFNFLEGMIYIKTRPVKNGYVIHKSIQYIKITTHE